ncbi:serine proteinase inhibitor [Ancylostoma ceylanicum]|uniref:Serine proteinase inhibitor n=1 Tax=Ancylostoma ceylanicum TaxID=53326 RepID=A0A0D6L6G3_9BILA|nr:serine proteinase inhibitor [Ancylostoma ceylanicum]
MLRLAPASEALVVSPLSVIFALAMVQAGAEGSTRSQIDKLIARGAPEDSIADYYSGLSQQVLKATDGVKNRIANGFFLNNKYQIEKEYENTIVKKYSAKVESYDFRKAEETARTINDFVSKVTEGKIHDMLEADAVRGAFSVIVNAIYFTAEWQYKFYKNSNTKQMFFSEEGKGKMLDFMNDRMDHRLYAEDDVVQVLSLTYKDTSYAFNIFLPKKRFLFRFALGEVMKKLDGSKVQKLLSKLEMTFITLSIPKMKIETKYGLKEALIKMGVTDLFNSKADLSGICKSPPLQISDALHNAIIEVDEEGTTAAAATMFLPVGSALIMEEPKKFIADHPFIFILTEDKNPLFMGQFV